MKSQFARKFGTILFLPIATVDHFSCLVDGVWVLIQYVKNLERLYFCATFARQFFNSSEGVLVLIKNFEQS